MNAKTSLPASPAAVTGPSLAFADAFARELAQSSHGTTREACLRAAASACRELLAQRWAATQASDRRSLASGTTRRVHYLSMEFLMGRALGNALAALGLEDDLRRAGFFSARKDSQSAGLRSTRPACPR